MKSQFNRSPTKTIIYVSPRSETIQMQPTSAVTPNIHQDLWISRVKSLPYRNIHTAGPDNETQDGHVASVFSISFTSDGQHVFLAPGLEDRIVVVWDICTRRMKSGSFRGSMQMSSVCPHCSTPPFFVFFFAAKFMCILSPHFLILRLRHSVL